MRSGNRRARAGVPRVFEHRTGADTGWLGLKSVADRGRPARLPRLHRRAYAHHMLRLLRLAILVVMTLIVISLIVAIARPETGPAEKVFLGVAAVGLIVAARPVQRLGSRAA